MRAVYCKACSQGGEACETAGYEHDGEDMMKIAYVEYSCPECGAGEDSLVDGEECEICLEIRDDVECGLCERCAQFDDNQIHDIVCSDNPTATIRRIENGR